MELIQSKSPKINEFRLEGLSLGLSCKRRRGIIHNLAASWSEWKASFCLTAEWRTFIISVSCLWIWWSSGSVLKCCSAETVIWQRSESWNRLWVLTCQRLGGWGRQMNNALELLFMPSKIIFAPRRGCGFWEPLFLKREDRYTHLDFCLPLGSE